MPRPVVPMRVPRAPLARGVEFPVQRQDQRTFLGDAQIVRA